MQHFFHARIRMASQQGDIICEGTIEGDVIAETQGEGDFKARWLFSFLIRGQVTMNFVPQGGLRSQVEG